MRITYKTKTGKEEHSILMSMCCLEREERHCFRLMVQVCIPSMEGSQVPLYFPMKVLRAPWRNVDSGCGEGIYKISLEHLIAPESEEPSNTNRLAKRAQNPTPRGFQWPKMGI